MDTRDGLGLGWWRESDPHIDPEIDIVPGTNRLMERDPAIAARINRAGYCPTGAT